MQVIHLLILIETRSSEEGTQSAACLQRIVALSMGLSNAIDGEISRAQTVVFGTIEEQSSSGERLSTARAGLYRFDTSVSNRYTKKQQAS